MVFVPVATGLAALAPRIVAGATRVASAIRTNPVRSAVGAAGIAAVAVGGTFAITDAASLYNTRTTQAGQFQQQEVFPNDLIQNDANRNFYMSFKFQAYEKRSINNSPFLRSTGTVRIPIPDNIRDNMSVTYGSTSFGGDATGTAVGAGLESLAGSRQTESSGFLSFVNRARDLGTDVAKGATVGLLQDTAGRVGQAAQAYFGIAVNPYQTILFEKPEFKSHNFSWKFMPRDESESNTIRNIIRTFQFHMLPGVSKDIGLFFSYPSMVVVSLFPSSEFMYRFKPCVIESVNVNYAAAGAPSFFKSTSAPTAITMSITLKEIEYWTSKDYTAEAFNDTEAIGSNALLTVRTGNMRSEVRGPGQFGNTPFD